MHKFFASACLFAIACGPMLAAQIYCPLEDLGGGTYRLYYCDRFEDPADCPDGEKVADYWYGPEQFNVPWTNCSHCLSKLAPKGKSEGCDAKIKQLPKGLPYVGLEKRVSIDYQHQDELPTEAQERGSLAIDVHCVVKAVMVKDGEKELVAYAKVFMLRVPRKGMAPAIRFVALEVKPGGWNDAEAAEVVVTPLKGEYAYNGRFLTEKHKNLLVITAQ